jgi:uncharacterized protein YecE (DUF72 family)
MPVPTNHDVESGILIGTAGWSIPSAATAKFPGEGSHLERYARRFSAVEINSSFHRPHRVGTYRRWAAAVPPEFRFSVKLPRTITHGQRLVAVNDLLAAFSEEVAGLGDKLAVVLVQLPPSLAFDADVADAFFAALARHIGVSIACEPRHATWFTKEADARLASHRVARVAADPVLAPGGERPGGWPGLQYRRLHGSPRTYYSSYDEAQLRQLATGFQRRGDLTVRRWCIFDNTASGVAASNALELDALLSKPR